MGEKRLKIKTPFFVIIGLSSGIDNIKNKLQVCFECNLRQYTSIKTHE